MNIIAKPRNCGKTFDLVRLSAETNIPIVSMAPEYVCDLATKHGYDIPAPLSPFQFKNNPPTKIYVDDVDYIMQYLIGASIEACTLTSK